MCYYVGLDVSLKKTSLCIVDQEGNIILEKSVSTNPDTIYKCIAETGYEIHKVGFENGMFSNYLLNGLKELGLSTYCIDSHMMAKLISININKTDKNDARCIADAMRCNNYKEVIPKSMEALGVSNVLSARESYVRQRVEIMNKMRATLRGYGIVISGATYHNFEDKVSECFEQLDANALISIKSQLSTLSHFSKEIKSLTSTIEKMVHTNSDAQNLMTIPGVGPIVAITFITEIGDCNRFEQSRSVGAYIGITPRQYSSGEITRQGGISKCGNGYLRKLLRGSATVIMGCVKSWSKLKAWAMKLCKKCGFKKAATALARKLAVVMHRMLVTGEPFRFSELELENA